MPEPAAYTVLKPGAEIVTDIDRRKSRFLTVMRRVDSPDDAQDLVDTLRREHHSARHHCSAWIIGDQRRIQRANDDGEPSGTAGAPMLEALTKAEMRGGERDLSDVAVVVVRWFGGTLLGAGGLVSAYSDSVIASLEEARLRDAFLIRQRMRLFRLAAPVAGAGRWENELRSTGVTVLATDYLDQPGDAVLSLAVPDSPRHTHRLAAQVAALSSGAAQPEEAGTRWVDRQR